MSLSQWNSHWLLKSLVVTHCSFGDSQDSSPRRKHSPWSASERVGWGLVVLPCPDTTSSEQRGCSGQLETAREEIYVLENCDSSGKRKVDGR